MINLFVALIAGVILLNLTLVFGRILRGPGLFDRLAGLGVVGTNTVVLFLLLGASSGRLDMFVDIAIGYAALGFMTFLIVAKYLERKGDIEG